MSTRIRGAEHTGTLTAAANLAATYIHLGKLVEAEELQVRLLATSARVRGTTHPDTLTVARNLALTHSGLGKDADADALHTQYRL